jgi:hypothetical protein
MGKVDLPKDIVLQPRAEIFGFGQRIVRQKRTLKIRILSENRLVSDRDQIGHFLCILVEEKIDRRDCQVILKSKVDH